MLQVTADEKQPVKKKRKRHQQKEDEKKKDSADGIFKPNLGHISLLTPKVCYFIESPPTTCGGVLLFYYDVPAMWWRFVFLVLYIAVLVLPI